MDYFDLLEVERAFTLDLEALERNYLRLQSTHHPDKAGVLETKDSLKISSKINVAYKTLVNDLTRAEYLLSLNGLYLKDCSAQDLREILLETMQANETLHSISEQESLQNFVIEQNKRRKKVLQEMHQAFAEQNQKKCLIQTCHLKYLEKILIEAKKRFLLV